MSLAHSRRPLSPHSAAKRAPPTSSDGQTAKHHPRPHCVTFTGSSILSATSPVRKQLQRQLSTSKPDHAGIGDPSSDLQQASRRSYPYHNSRSYESASTASSGHQHDVVSGYHSRHNSYPTRRNRASAASADKALRPDNLAICPRRMRPKPPPLNLTAALWDSGQTSETDCSVASSSSPPRSSSASSPVNSSPSASPRLLQQTLSRASPNHSPRDSNQSPRTNHYFSLPPLSPIPHSPQPSNTPTNIGIGRRTSSPYRSSHSHSPCSPRGMSPCQSPGGFRCPSPGPPCQSPGYRSTSPAPVGHLARLASRRKSHAATGMRRRTSNFLELPVSDYERQRRYCSLPEHGYNPRCSNEFYRLRAFSISPKGALIKHGDQLASRRSRSSAGSTTNTSRQASRSPSRGASPFASHSGSRDVSPLARSPVGGPPGGASKSPWSSHQSASPVGGGPPGGAAKSPWSSHQSGLEDEEHALSYILEQPGKPEEAEEEEGVKYRVCILGQNATGKTALVNQVLTSEYMNTYDASLDEDFGERSVSVVLDGEESELVFIDHTNGEMSVENTLSTYAPHACVVVYSVTDRASFLLAEEILGYLWRVSFAEVGGRASVILVGNKVDLERSRVIQQEEGKKLAMSFGAKFIETSAGLQHNVDELLVGVLKQIRLRQEDRGGGQAGRSGQQGKAGARTSVSSPLHTLQVARDILARVCLNAKPASVSKSCENLHVL